MTPIRVLLVDDHPPILEGYVSMVERETDMAVVGTAHDGEAAVQQAQAVQPDVVLMDIEMGEMNGIQATRRLQMMCPQSRVLIASAHDRQEYVLQALAAGAWNYVLKDLAAKDLTTAIRATARGERYLHPKVMPTLLDAMQQHATSVAAPKVGSDALTSRELEVLGLVAQGLTNEELARVLSVSVFTVKNHMRAILRKLNVSSRRLAVQEARQRGILSWL